MFLVVSVHRKREQFSFGSSFNYLVVVLSYSMFFLCVCLSSRKRLSMLDARRHSRISKISDNKTMLTNTGVHEVQRLGLNPQDFIGKSFSRGVSLTELGMKLLEERMKAQVPNTIGTSADPNEQPKAEIVEEVPSEAPQEAPKEAPLEEPVEVEEEDIKFHKKDKGQLHLI